METMTANVLEIWGTATDEQITAAHDWYPMARNLALVIGRGDIRMGAGIIAALSPQKSWAVNQRLAWRTLSGVVSGQVGDAVRKTQRIMSGEDPDSVLPKGLKTWHFYHNILEPENSEFVTIDRHAYRAATFEWDNGSPVIKPKIYSQLLTAYQQGARIARVPAPAFQAGCWIAARER
jgi:hypothetical protein